MRGSRAAVPKETKKVDSWPERADFRPERASSRPERADSRPERADFRPERADFRPQRAWWGRTDERMNRQTDGRMDGWTESDL